jgi:type II secretory pathway predicted ATPase ExeA
MYGHHFGLASAPFRITPDTHRFYPGAQRGAVLDALTYAILQGEGIVKLSGEVGSGKTMLCRMLAERLAPQVDIVYLANPSLRREDVLEAVALELKLPTDGSRLETLQALHTFLLERHIQGRRVAVFVEEAQGMDLEALEEIRLLSNLETREDKLLQIVLFGQPELDVHLAAHAVRQLRDRITHSFSLPPLTLADVRDYIPFRLRAAGYQGGDPFSPMAYRLLVRASKGLIRRIHVIADKALLAAYAGGSRQVRLRHVRQAIADSEFGPRGRVPAPRSEWAYAAGVTALMAAGIAPLATAPRPGVDNDARQPAGPVSIQQAAGAGGMVSDADRITRLEHIQPDIGSHFAARSSAARAWLSSDTGARYTIQIMTSDSDASSPVERYLQASTRLAHLDELYIVPTHINGLRRWSVLYGSFDNYAAAQQALQNIPPALQGHGPYLRSLTAVKKEASGHWLPARQDT